MAAEGVLRTAHLVGLGLDHDAVARWTDAARLHRKYRAVSTLDHRLVWENLDPDEAKETATDLIDLLTR